MEHQISEFLALAAKIAREFDNIPGLPDPEIGSALGVSKQAAHKLAGAAISSLREKLAAMGFSGLDTLGLLKSQSSSGCGVSPQAVQEASRLLISSSSSPQVDDFPPQP